MNILHVTLLGDSSLLQKRVVAGDFGGGIAVSLRNIAHSMEKSYKSHTTITCCFNSEFVPWAHRNNLEVHVMPAFWVCFWGRPLFVMVSISDLIKYIKANKIDVVHAHYFPAALCAGMAAILTGIPMVVSIHQNISDYVSYSKNILIRLMNLFRRLFFRMLWEIPFRIAGKVIAVSAYVKETMMKDKYQGSKIEVVHNGVDTNIYVPDFNNKSFRKELGLSDEHILIGITGRFHVSKGYREIIHASVEIQKKAPLARFVFIGEGEERHSYKLLADELNVADIILFPGLRENMQNVLPSLDIFLLPTYHREGFPLSILEAMAVGLPIVISDVGGNFECIEHYKSGLFIKPNDPKQISDAVLTLIRDPLLAQKLADGARKRVTEFFTVEKQCQKLMHIYTQLLRI